MLNAWSTIKVDEFLDLRFPFAVRRFVDWHLHIFLGGGHDDRFERGKFGANLFIINGPKAMESKTFFITGYLSAMALWRDRS